MLMCSFLFTLLAKIANHKKEKAAGWTWSGLAELVKYSRVSYMTNLSYCFNLQMHLMYSVESDVSSDLILVRK